MVSWSSALSLALYYPYLPLDRVVVVVVSPMSHTYMVPKYRWTDWLKGRQKRVVHRIVNKRVGVSIDGTGTKDSG